MRSEAIISWPRNKLGCVFFKMSPSLLEFLSFKWFSKAFRRDTPSPTPSPPLPPFSHSIARATNRRGRPCSRTALSQTHGLALRCAFVRLSRCDRNTSAFASPCVDLPPRTRRRRRRERRRKPGAAEWDSGGVARHVTCGADVAVVTWTAEREVAAAPPAAAELRWRCDNQKAFIVSEMRRGCVSACVPRE